MRYLIIPVSVVLLISYGCVNGDPVSPIVDDHQIGTVFDIDNNIYETIMIGKQWWTAGNLKVMRYNNGDMLHTGLDNRAWGKATSGAYTVYPYYSVDDLNSAEDMIEAYGILYNWFAVDDERGLCPEGWRIPTDADWKALEMYLGVSLQEADKTGWRETDEGGKLKSIRTDPILHPKWISPNIGATDESGWSGLPGGFRDSYGDYSYIGSIGRWWSSSEHGHGSSYALFRSLSSNSKCISRFVTLKQHGFSVRCLRDDQ
jgi:uncharacterized protein (TIGR02145 family)